MKREFCAVKPVSFRIKVGGKEHMSLESLKANFRFDVVDQLWREGALKSWCERNEKKGLPDPVGSTGDRAFKLCEFFFGEKIEEVDDFLVFLERHKIPRDKMVYLVIANEKGTKIWNLLDEEDLRKIIEFACKEDSEVWRGEFEDSAGTLFRFRSLREDLKECFFRQSKKYDCLLKFLKDPETNSQNVSGVIVEFFEEKLEGEELQAALALLENCQKPTAYNYAGTDMLLYYASLIKNGVEEEAKILREIHGRAFPDEEPLLSGPFNKDFCRSILRIMLIETKL